MRVDDGGTLEGVSRGLYCNQLDGHEELWDSNGTRKEVTMMCWEREEPTKASEEIDEVLKKIVKEAEQEKETEVPAKAG